MEINVLGTTYKIIVGNKVTHEILSDIDGFTDTSTKEIVIDEFEVTKDSKKNLDEYRNSVIRHEIIHAFLYESGLCVNSNSCESWATNEEMVDWIAIQSPKLLKAFNEAKCI